MYSKLLGFSLLILSFHIKARFSHNDAMFIDQEYDRISEYYNDKISYNYPLFWKKDWLTNSNAFRSTFGSLDYFQFYHEEAVKLTSSYKDPLVLSYKRYGYGNGAKQISHNEVKFSGNIYNGVFLSLVGDGDSQKKFYDTGPALRYQLSPTIFIELTYWFVDGFYWQKERIDGEKIRKPTCTLQIDFFYQKDALIVDTQIEIDTPLVWTRGFYGYEYTYAKKALRSSALYQTKGSWDIGLELLINNKKEGKSILEHSSQKLDFIQDIIGFELSFGNKNTRGYQEYGINYYIHHSKYQKSNELKNSSKQILEIPASSYYKTKDIGFYFKNYEHLETGREFYFVWGSFINNVDHLTQQIPINNRWEVKAITSLHFVISKSCSAVLNVSWDLDVAFDHLFNNGSLKSFFGGGGASFKLSI